MSTRGTRVDANLTHTYLSIYKITPDSNLRSYIWQVLVFFMFRSDLVFLIFFSVFLPRGSQNSLDLRALTS